jgi:7-cyano-7-deazaguanine synthase in queuosine biosynthesis
MSKSLFDLWDDFMSAIMEDKIIYTDSGYASLISELVNCMIDFPQNPGVKIAMQEPKLYSTVVLISGGMDSAIAWELTKDEPDRLALFIDFQHEYSEKEKAAIQKLNIPVKIEKISDINFLPRWEHIIPGRNYLLLAMAERYVRHEGEIWLSAVQGESSETGGDKSELFFRLFERFIWLTNRKVVKVKTLKEKTKTAWLEWYIDTTGRIDILQSVSCVNGGDKECGGCHSCVRKWLAMQHAGLTDWRLCFTGDPQIAGKKYIDEYRVKLRYALEHLDFYHYSKDRCEEDLSVLDKIY